MTGKGQVLVLFICYLLTMDQVIVPIWYVSYNKLYDCHYLVTFSQLLYI